MNAHTLNQDREKKERKRSISINYLMKGDGWTDELKANIDAFVGKVPGTLAHPAPLFKDHANSGAAQFLVSLNRRGINTLEGQPNSCSKDEIQRSYLRFLVDANVGGGPLIESLKKDHRIMILVFCRSGILFNNLIKMSKWEYDRSSVLLTRPPYGQPLQFVTSIPSDYENIFDYPPFTHTPNNEFDRILKWIDSRKLSQISQKMSSSQLWSLAEYKQSRIMTPLRNNLLHVIVVAKDFCGDWFADRIVLEHAKAIGLKKLF